MGDRHADDKLPAVHYRLNVQLIHKTYLPFTPEQLVAHFAPVKGKADDQRHLKYYQRSVEAHQALLANKSPTPPEIKRGRQMEKDERFWVATALMSLFHANDGAQRNDLFASLMQSAGTEPPHGLGNWSAALAGELCLYFEVNLASPQAYTDWLKDQKGQRTPIPYAREAAEKQKGKLEGATHIDAMLLVPETGTAVLFEAKVLSDVSTTVSFDLTRNQLARTIDVALEPGGGLGHLPKRRPDRTYVVLLTPEILSPRTKVAGGHQSRLYGWLTDAYRAHDNTLLSEHLPYRSAEDLAGARTRLGWVTWEDCNTVLPGACPWLPS